MENSKNKINQKRQSQNRNQNSDKSGTNENENVKEVITKQNGKKIFVRHLWWIDALLFIGGTILFGGLATLLGGKMFNFQNYEMPEGTAPKIVFPICWAIIYVAIGVSTFLMWRDKEIKEDDRKLNLIFYFVHIGFNVLWPLFFFRLDFPIFSCVWLLLVLISALVVMYRYYTANIVSGIIFSIYCLWLIYALYLNLGLCLLNF